MYGGILCMTAQNITGTYDTTEETIPFRKNNLYDLPSVIKNEGSYRHI